MEPTGIVSALPNEASLGRLQSWPGLSGLAERVLFGFYLRLSLLGHFLHQAGSDSQRGEGAATWQQQQVQVHPAGI